MNTYSKVTQHMKISLESQFNDFSGRYAACLKDQDCRISELKFKEMADTGDILLFKGTTCASKA